MTSPGADDGRSRPSWARDDGDTWADDSGALGGDQIFGEGGFSSSGMIGGDVVTSADESRRGADRAAPAPAPGRAGTAAAPASPAAPRPGAGQAGPPPEDHEASSGPEKTQGRQPWMEEDRDIWSSADRSVPPMIG